MSYEEAHPLLFALTTIIIALGGIFGAYIKTKTTPKGKSNSDDLSQQRYNELKDNIEKIEKAVNSFQLKFEDIREDIGLLKGKFKR